MNERLCVINKSISSQIYLAIKISKKVIVVLGQTDPKFYANETKIPKVILGKNKKEQWKFPFY